MINIVPYEPKYKEDLQKVCLNTAYETAYEPKERNFLLNTYCDYYLDVEGACCFAAVDENDVAQGYILCAPDYKRFRKAVKPYAKIAAKSGFAHAVAGIGERFVTGLFSRSFPAHMHIDINPGFQRMGVGTKLVDALFQKLKSENVKGIMLIVSTGNTKGMNFYLKYGFHRTATVGPGTVMTYKFQK